MPQLKVSSTPSVVDNEIKTQCHNVSELDTTEPVEKIETRRGKEGLLHLLGAMKVEVTNKRKLKSTKERQEIFSRSKPKSSSLESTISMFQSATEKSSRQSETLAPDLIAAASAAASTLPNPSQAESELLQQLREHETITEAQKKGDGNNIGTIIAEMKIGKNLLRSSARPANQIRFDDDGRGYTHERGITGELDSVRKRTARTLSVGRNRCRLRASFSPAILYLALAQAGAASGPRELQYVLPAPSHPEHAGNGEYISNLALLEEDFDEYTEQKSSPVTCSDYQGSRILHHHHNHHPNPPPPQPLLATHVPVQQQVPAPGAPLSGHCSISQRKSNSSRRNAWGNMSYADLITKAIESSPEKRLTLSQIYDWMVKSVPYFNDKGDSNSSAGWKNSIRHNLSLHSRFVRIQNEGTGKSSWWMMNPEGGKNGKSPRRRAASMDNNSKFTKSKGRASKKKMAVSDLVDSSSHSPSPHTEDLDSWNTFRTRTSSDASTVSGRRSPYPSEHDEMGEPDIHMSYPVGPKLTTTLPRLSEVTGSIAQRGSENVMENLLDNLNLLSPQNSHLASDTAHTSNGSMYNQVKMTPLLPVRMQANKASFGGYENSYNCSPIHKTHLASDGEATRSSLMRTGCLLPPYKSQSILSPCTEGKMPSSQPILSHQSPLPSRELNTCNMIPLTSLTSRPGASPRLPHTTHSNHFMVPSNCNGYTELTVVHPHGHHQDRLPSDLDNMSIERFECDMESVLHDTLMDGGALDFNFEPAGTQGFPPRGKNITHSWVSG
ncbi:hypothetical protein WMY93_007851 [Mugilogobius chulae]|uniref:Fork-head domain-containing protein n=1 Tax=Mugilogobius chulae TaxID=88201 RepID=A0AAW0PE75_9GOBI